MTDSVENIESGAFRGCASLKEIVFGGTKEQWEAVSKGRDWKIHVRNLRVHCKDGDVRYR